MTQHDLATIAIWKWCHPLTGCCPKENLFERSLKRFLFINLDEMKEK